MRVLFAGVVVWLVFPVVGLIRGGESQIQILEAEVKRLRQENARLGEQLSHLGDLMKMAQANHELERAIEGIWKIHAATRDGLSRTWEVGAEVEFRGNRVILRLPGRQEAIRAEVWISAPTRQVNFVRLGSTPTGTALDARSGLFELNGKRLRISLQSAYTIPKEISDRAQVLWVLERKKP